MENKWLDISQPLTNDMAHWPGDTPFTYSISYSKSETGSVNIGQITTSLHIGTHVDAPFHFDSNGKKITDLNINHFIGEAMVIDVSDADEITVDILQKFNWDNVTRVLLRTSLPNNPKLFPDKTPVIDDQIAAFLAEKGVVLFGIDVPSVDALDSKDLPTHHALAKHGIHILENVMLDHVSPGKYELVALPLAIHGADGSPVRAVIRSVEGKENVNE